AFWKQRRKAGFVEGSGPPLLTAMAISFPIRVNCLAIRSHRANIVAFRTSKILPMMLFSLSHPDSYRDGQKVKKIINVDASLLLFNNNSLNSFTHLNREKYDDAGVQI
ncbi:MAG TPA: hypothetical protein VG676_05460, partial [Chitinophagaceae bacterium]|nr:hypothetical protein [Chitinophagaceae bacterium]